MAVVDRLTGIITDLDAGTPAAVTDMGGRVRSVAAHAVLTSGHSTDSTYRMVRVPSNARIEEIHLYCDAITTCSTDVGLYQTAANGSAVLDRDCYGSAISLASALTSLPVNAAFEVRNITNVLNRVWEDAGLTVDPKRDFDIVLTLTADAGSTGDVTVIARYVVD